MFSQTDIQNMSIIAITIPLRYIYPMWNEHLSKQISAINIVTNTLVHKTCSWSSHQHTHTIKHAAGQVTNTHVPLNMQLVKSPTHIYHKTCSWSSHQHTHTIKHVAGQQANTFTCLLIQFLTSNLIINTPYLLCFLFYPD